MLRLDVAPDLTLVQLDEPDAEELYLRIATERERLREWLPWAESSTLASTRAFCTGSADRCEQGNGFDLGIWVDGRLLGVIGANSFDPVNRVASLGYWLSAGVEGRGVMTRAAVAVLDHCFGPLGLARVEIRVAPENARSLAVVRRLGAREEGRAREAALVAGRRQDLVIFGILAREWLTGAARRDLAARAP